MGDFHSPRVTKVTGKSIVPLVITLSPEKPNRWVEIEVRLSPASFIMSKDVSKMISAEIQLSIKIPQTRLFVTGAEMTIMSLSRCNTRTTFWLVKKKTRIVTRADPLREVNMLGYFLLRD